MVQELHSTDSAGPKTCNSGGLGEKRMPTVKTWKTRPTHFVLLEILSKKGDMTDDDLFDALKDQFDDIGYGDFNELLMRLEVAGKIRTASMAPGKKDKNAI